MFDSILRVRWRFQRMSLCLHNTWWMCVSCIFDSKLGPICGYFWCDVNVRRKTKKNEGSKRYVWFLITYFRFSSLSFLVLTLFGPRYCYTLFLRFQSKNSITRPTNWSNFTSLWVVLLPVLLLTPLLLAVLAALLSLSSDKLCGRRPVLMLLGKGTSWWTF